MNTSRLLFCMCWKLTFNTLSANPTKWSNTLKQFIGKLPTNCLSVFDRFVGLALKGLRHQNNINEQCSIVFIVHLELMKNINLVFFYYDFKKIFLWWLPWLCRICRIRRNKKAFKIAKFNMPAKFLKDLQS